MKKIALFFVIFLLNCPLLAQKQPDLLKFFLANHFEKTGGLKNWQSLKTIYKEGIISLYNQEKCLFREYTLVDEICRQDIIRADSSMQSMIFSPEYEAVEYFFTHYKDQKAQRVRRTNALFGRDLGAYEYALHSQILAAPPAQSHFLGYEELIESDSMVLIKIRNVQPFLFYLRTLGIVQEFYFYKSTALLDRVTIDLNNQYVSFRTQYLLSNYQTIKNLSIPMQVEQVENALTLKTIQYQKILLNEEIDRSIFRIEEKR